MAVRRMFMYRLTVGSTKILEFILYAISFVLMPFTKVFTKRILSRCDIQVNGNRRWDPKVTDNRFYCQVAKKSYFGFVDAYSRGYIECEDLSALLLKIYSSKYYKVFCMHPTLVLRSFFERKFFTQTISNAYVAGKVYDERLDTVLPPDEEGRTMTTGYWKDAHTLRDATNAKLDLVARKLKLKPGMRILDVGCGEGTLCKHLAKNYDVEVVGINVSGDHLIQARRVCKGLKVKFAVMDARQIVGTFDRITCLGVIEHMGVKDWRVLFNVVRRCLVDDGIFLIETGSTNHPFVPTFDAPLKRWFTMHVNWSYYFDIMKSIEGLFVIEDWQNLRKHFEKTTKAWKKESDGMWEKNVTQVGERVARSLKAGQAHLCAFASSGYLQTYQIVLSKNGLPGGYETVV